MHYRNGYIALERTEVGEAPIIGKQSVDTGSQPELGGVPAIQPNRESDDRLLIDPHDERRTLTRLPPNADSKRKGALLCCFRADRHAPQDRIAIAS